MKRKEIRALGVGHQYCGNVGKTANSQVAVMGCLSNGDFASMVDARLYLPKDWCNDPERCEKAGIPEEEREFKTKIDLAYEMMCALMMIRHTKAHCVNKPKHQTIYKMVDYVKFIQVDKQ
ncbi:MAG: transposase, partial [Bacteroidales bacterium]